MYFRNKAIFIEKAELHLKSFEKKKSWNKIPLLDSHPICLEGRCFGFVLLEDHKKVLMQIFFEKFMDDEH